MQNLLHEEVRTKIHEIRKVKNARGDSDLISAVSCILHMAELFEEGGMSAVRDGLRQWRHERNATYLQFIAGMAINGLPEDMVELLGMMRYCTSDLKAYDGLTCLIYLQGLKMIQRGEEFNRIEHFLTSMLPAELSVTALCQAE